MISNNIKFNYLYRDGSNYKNYRSIVFGNPNCIPIHQIENTILTNLIDGEFFYAEKWDLPILFFEELNCDDHGFHEFKSIELTTDRYDNITIEEFIFKIVKT